jgi:flagella basal body P-ring formation protein FlgA
MLVAGLFAPARPACIEVEADRISAADFAASIAGFAALPAATPLAAAPLPGMRRRFRKSDLASLAKRYAIDISEVDEICFERPTEALDRAKVLDAMRETLGREDVRIEIVEMSKYSVPRGRLEFKRAGLGRPASPDGRTPVEWRGNVVYAGDRRFAVWARVIVSARVTRAVAAGKLRRGEQISAGQVAIETVDMFPPADDVARSVDQVAGRTPLCDIAAGTGIRLSLLASPPDVTRGQEVEVEVRSGAARIVLTGMAESAGRLGETVAIRNLSSNKVFQARVSGAGRASLDLGRAIRN